MNASPATLDHAGIAARIPHAGPMCLLDAMLGWDPQQLRCRITNHADAAHPLRVEGGLLACNAIEYAAQAMALHAALMGEDSGGDSGVDSGSGAGFLSAPGFLASAREVQQFVARLDDAPGPLEVQATRLAGDGTQALYRFRLADADGRTLVQGRTTVVLNTPLAQS